MWALARHLPRSCDPRPERERRLWRDLSFAPAGVATDTETYRRSCAWPLVGQLGPPKGEGDPAELQRDQKPMFCLGRPPGGSYLAFHYDTRRHARAGRQVGNGPAEQQPGFLNVGRCGHCGDACGRRSRASGAGCWLLCVASLLARCSSEVGKPEEAAVLDRDGLPTLATRLRCQGGASGERALFRRNSLSP